MPVKKRKCKYCKTYTDKFIVVPAGTFCDNMDCAVRFAMDKRQKDIEKARKKKAKEFKERVGLKRKTSEKELAQRAFNKWLKLEYLLECKSKGKQPECISCGKLFHSGNMNDLCAGHYKTRGARPDLALNTLNVWPQCNHRCNCQLSGNISGAMGTKGYTQGLSDWLGNEKAASLLETLDKRRKTIKYTPEDYQRCRKWISARSRALQMELNQ